MNRVVITGIGVVAPNGGNVETFVDALKKGRSGIKFYETLRELNFACQVAGVPEVDDSILSKFLSKGMIRGLKSTAVKYACIASLEAYFDAGLTIEKEAVDWDTGSIYGCTGGDADLAKEVIGAVDLGKPRSLGSRYVAQIMTSAPAAYLTQLFGMGNHVYSNSSACSTGTESLLMSYERIKSGMAKRMIAGACESSSKYSWGAFDAMRVMNGRHNDEPTKASRPMSATAGGFVPGSGAATFILEDLETARARGAKIYAEILGGAMNCGGQRNKGTMTAPNRIGVKKCINDALANANITADQIDLISGHLTATYADEIEVSNWSEALNLSGEDFPYINSPKSMIGHCLCAAGTIESAATVLQMEHGFIHPSINSEDTHPNITALIDEKCIPKEKIDKDIDVAIKANFGFGDVNSCIVFKKTIH